MTVMQILVLGSSRETAGGANQWGYIKVLQKKKRKKLGDVNKRVPFKP